MPFDGPSLAALRARRRLSQPQLAAMAGCHWVSVSRWEHGHHQPSAEQIVRLAAALRVSAARLMPAAEPLTPKES